ncbi:MAG: trimethylamine methyltransferase [Candidatus Syntrophonatronum acetioxidans]|uniref:Trimethylamine methyltransferase n=1 Tax=Candidatus Syntrophonatronum acetioxidans TaxID=1795816 RepID=A0A424YCP0_9FIRM|nr:MAG: trimethylamine methyltransferase [Candidatus Syntrophonatronum acetioxidans]
MKNEYYGGLYHILSEKDIDEIHETTMRILWEIGFDLTYIPALELLEKNGATVDWQNKKAYLPRKLVSRCIKQAPSEITFYGLEEGKEIVLGGERVHYGTGGLALYVLDTNRDRRPALLKDIASFAHLSDKLEYVDFYIIPTNPYDVNINSLDVNCFYQALRHTGKPVMGGVFSREGLQRVLELSSLIAGGMENLRKRPFVGFISSITSPLKIEEDRAEIIFEVARQGLPLVTSAAPIAGATSPLTIAGTLAQQNAESLLGVVLAQLVNPGTPIFYSAVPCTMDMRSGSFLMGSIQSGLMNAAVSQLAYHYRLPSYITVGVADSKLPDAQAAYESATSSLLSGLAGGNFIHQTFGLLDGALTISYAKFVIDNDIVGKCLRTLKGIDVNPDTLAFDVIAKVKKGGGDFITQRHTLDHLRSEEYIPRVSFLQDYQTWVKFGEKDAWVKAEEVAQKLLEEPGKIHIPESLDRKIQELFQELVQLEEVLA